VTLPAIHPKIAGGAVGGYVAVILLYVLHQYVGFNPPGDVGNAITGLLILATGALSPDPTVSPTQASEPFTPPPSSAPAPGAPIG
jgi:hypothetical protein